MCVDQPSRTEQEGHSTTVTSLNMTLARASGPGEMRGRPRRPHETCALRALAVASENCVSQLQHLYLHLPAATTTLTSRNVTSAVLETKHCLLMFFSRPRPFDVKWWSWWNLPLACCLPSGLYQVQNSSSFHVWKTGRIYWNLYKCCEK